MIEGVEQHAQAGQIDFRGRARLAIKHESLAREGEEARRGVHCMGALASEWRV